MRYLSEQRGAATLQHASERIGLARADVRRATRRYVPATVRRTLAFPLVHGALVIGLLILFVSHSGVESYNSYVVELLAIYVIAALAFWYL